MGLWDCIKWICLLSGAGILTVMLGLIIFAVIMKILEKIFDL